MNFSTKLIEVRKAKGLTQEELASKCNITARTIQRIEAGQVQPRTHTIRTISEILDFEFFNSTGHLNNHSIFWYIKDLFNLKTQKMRKVSILSLAVIALILTNLLIQAQPFVMKNPKSGISISYNQDNSIKRVDVVFTNELTLDSLVDIRKRLLGIKISLAYELMEFDDNGHLNGITCYVRQDGGFRGYIKTPEIKPEELSGFYYVYSENSKGEFCRGSCWQN